MIVFLFVTCFVSIRINGEIPCNFTSQSQCGDAEECHSTLWDCLCDNKYINILQSDLYCCVPPPKDEPWCQWPDACVEGDTISKTVPCQGKCYNDYKIDYNMTLGPRAMFQCDNGEECVRVSAMCQGYALCSDKSDLKECDSNLKCVTNTWSTSTLHSLGSGHHYCQYHETDNDGKYDNIGRKDEDTLDVTSNELVIDANELKECYYDNRLPGLTCGENCVENYEWCRPDRSFACTNNQEEFSLTNSRICGNFTFWEEISCFIAVTSSFENLRYSFLKIRYVPPYYPYYPPNATIPKVLNWWLAAGKRCLGKMQHCYYPWYSVLYSYNEDNQGRLPSTCSDKSDQIFYLKDCRSFLDYLSEYTYYFCTPSNSEEYQDWIESGYWIENCANITYFEKYKDKDPHKCQESCANPGPGCQACTNPDYFHCQRNNSQVCLHPELLCDGHPQCDGGEDELLELCLGSYLKSGIVDEYATAICTSPMYSNMKMVATACDGISQCAGNLDEAGCGDRNYGALVSAVLMLVLFTALQIWEYCRNGGGSARGEKKIEINMDHTTQQRENVDTEMSMANLELLNILYTRDKAARIVEGKAFYDEQVRLCKTHSKVFCLLHKHMEPEVSKMILDAKFPGCFENNCPTVLDLLGKLDPYKKQISFIKRIWQITSYIVDLYKDIFILVTMITMSGGPQAVLMFPTKFSSVVIICSGLTIIIPLMISCIHLAINNPGIVFNCYGTKNQLKTFAMRIGVILLSVLNPILIINAYESISEKTRKMAKSHDPNLSSTLQKYRTVRRQHADFVRIELNLETFYQV